MITIRRNLPRICGFARQRRCKSFDLTGEAGAATQERRRGLFGSGATPGEALQWSTEYLKSLSSEDEAPKRGREGIVEEVADHMLRVGIFGGPNAGKSQLFNALVDPDDHNLRLEVPGATSDCKEAEASLGRMYFTAIDTPGVISSLPVPQLDLISQSVDLALFVVDVNTRGDDDIFVSDWLHSRKIPTILVANKADQGGEKLTVERKKELAVHGRPLYLSAREKTGFGALQDLIAPYHAMREAERKEEEWELEDKVIEGDVEAKDQLAERRRLDRPLRLAVVGFNNVGKSTLINALLGYSRVQVTSFPGTTRDMIPITARYRGTRVLLRDTPGFNKKSERWLLRDPKTHHKPLKDDVALWMHHKSVSACQWSSVILYMFDARLGVTTGVKHEVEMLLDLGRPVVLVANKWDEVEAKQEAASEIEEGIRSNNAIKHCTVVCISAKNATNLALLMDTVLDHYRRWHLKVSKGKLNLFWHRVQQTLHIPYNQAKARYLVQVASSPPTFAVFLSRQVILQGSLSRFLVNQIRKEFGMHGIPIRLLQRRKPPSVFKMLGYTMPTKVYKSAPSQMAVKWKAWERGATHDNNLSRSGKGSTTRMKSAMQHVPDHLRGSRTN